MRSIRSLVASSALAIVALGSMVGGVAAAPAQADRFTFDDAWCFQDVTTLYCTESSAFLKVTVNGKTGAERSVMHVATTTVVSEGGVEIGRYTTRSQDITLRSEERDARHSVAHTFWTGYGEKCTGTVVVKIVDFEVVIDHESVTCR